MLLMLFHTSLGHFLNRHGYVTSIQHRCVQSQLADTKVETQCAFAQQDEHHSKRTGKFHHWGSSEVASLKQLIAFLISPMSREVIHVDSECDESGSNYTSSNFGGFKLNL
jgi:hypothetical protein